MDRDLPMATELANLEKENGDRLTALIRGGVNLQPGTFELIQITVYLEHLLRLCDHEGTDYSLNQARMEFAEQSARLLDELESAARRAAISKHPLNGKRPGGARP